MTIGTQATVRFFMRRKNHRVCSSNAVYHAHCCSCAWAPEQSSSVSLQGSACFLFGFALVVWGWAIIGFVVETYGFFLLFRGFFPTVLSFLRNVPFLGRLLDAPALKTVGCATCTAACSFQLTTFVCV